MSETSYARILSSAEKVCSKAQAHRKCWRR
jgi:hypothetical protein